MRSMTQETAGNLQSYAGQLLRDVPMFQDNKIPKDEKDRAHLYGLLDNMRFEINRALGEIAS